MQLCSCAIFALQGGGSPERCLKKGNGQKLVRGRNWEKLSTSLCLIDCRSWTGTGFIGEKKGRLYLLTCWHNVAEEGDSAESILERVKESEYRFSYVEKKNPQWCLKGSTLLLQSEPLVHPQVCMPN